VVTCVAAAPLLGLVVLGSPPAAGVAAVTRSVGKGTEPAPAPHRLVPLGGLDLDSYCQSTGYDYSDTIRPRSSPGAAYDNWFCFAFDGRRAAIDLLAACEATYRQRPIAARPSDPNDANTWVCYRIAGKRRGGGGAEGGKPLPLNKFDAAGAAAWARANAPRSSNPYGYPNDCTDFVSRAMHIGGGMPERDGQGRPFPFNHADDHDWYMRWLGVGPVGHWVGTYSWGDSLHLLAFLKNAGLARQVSLQAARPGDVIFVNWGKGGRDLPHGQTDTSTPGGISHVGMIVANPGSQGDYNVQIAQHSNNTIERLSDWRIPNPHLHVWIYSIYYH
jgi:hypothetical protein